MPKITEAGGHVTIYFGADYRANNPYQQLLYASVGAGFRIRAATPIQALEKVTKKPHRAIYHLHWEEDVLKSATARNASARAAALCQTIADLRGNGVPLVWTRHNRRPHTATFLSEHAGIVSLLDDAADCIHLHGAAARKSLYGDKVDGSPKHVVIHHGHYDGCYPHWSQRIAREALDLPTEGHVFLLFGRLAAYKGLANAITAFRTVAHPDARLVLAGTPDQPGLAELTRSDPRISLHQQTVPNSHVGCFFAACDTVVLPYRESLTSGTAMLAGTMGRAVLGYDCAGLRDAFPAPETGVLIDPEGLASNMQMAVSEGREIWRQRGKMARKAALVRDWPSLGKQWRDVFQTIAN